MEGDAKLLNNPEELRTLTMHNYLRCVLTNDDMTHILKLSGAIVEHDYNDPLSPHIQLTNGDCTDGYVNVARALVRTNICQIFALCLVRKVQRLYGGQIDWVVSSEKGRDISHIIAEFLKAKHYSTIRCAGRTQKWECPVLIKPGETVLQIDEVIVTGQNPTAVRNAINKVHPYKVKFVPYIGAVVSRSKKGEMFEDQPAQILSLMRFDYEIWDDSCPLCKGGSPKMDPLKDWDKLLKEH